MATNQKYYRLVVYKFSYTECHCVWPVFFEFEPENKFGKLSLNLLDSSISDLRSIPGISDVRKVFDKITTLTECVETLDSILKDNEGKYINSEGCKIKYLEIEEQKLSSTPKLNYTTNRFYLPLEISGRAFPVRVRSEYFKFLLDDFELPLLTIISK